MNFIATSSLGCDIIVKGAINSNFKRTKNEIYIQFICIPTFVK